MKTWFLLNDGQVSGPFNPEEIETRLSQSKEPLIWGKGQTEWNSPDKWRKILKNLESEAQVKSSAPEKWHARIEGKELPAMDYEQLLDKLRAIKDYSNVDLKTDSNNVWKEIYSVQRVADDLGLTRRSHPRVPVVGTLTYDDEQNNKNTAKVISISEGGLGINDAKKFSIGERFRATIQSPSLYVTINATCEVVYVGNDGYAGLKFVGLPMEAKGAIIEYVNKFA